MKISSHISRRHANAVRALQIENNRMPGDGHRFPLSDIHPEKTKDNVFLIRSDNWMKGIMETLKEHGIIGYRKNAVVLIDVVYSASEDFFMDDDKEFAVKYFTDCLAFHESELGPALNAVIHFDESTPHMHVVSVPIVERENGYVLCAREMIGGKARLYRFHDHLHEEVGIKYDLDRGDRSDSITKKKHLDMYRYKYNCLTEKIAEAVSDLEMLNTDIERAGKIKDIQSQAVDIGKWIDSIISVLGGFTIDKIQEKIENRETLNIHEITKAGCHLTYYYDKTCFIDTFSHEPLSWGTRIPVYNRVDTLLVPSDCVMADGLIASWEKSEICPDTRTPLQCSVVDKLSQISESLEDLLETIDQEKEFIEAEQNDIDANEDETN